MADQITTDERYTSATHSSNLRVEAARPGDVDVLIAMGMSPSRLGAALLRLHSEWDGASRPRRMTQAAIDAYAATLGGKPDERARQARADADMWHGHELAMMLGRVKSLPAVRHQLTMVADRYRIEHAARIASAVLLWWLDPICLECHGQEREQIKDTPILSDVACPVCRGSGRKVLPHGDAGRKLMDCIDGAIDAARVSLKKRLRNY